MKKHVLITGGAGYVGSKLIPTLMEAGYVVTALDIAPLIETAPKPDFFLQGDIRNPILMKDALEGIDYVIHLACVSNDPSFDMDRQMGKSINYDCMRSIVKAAKNAGVQRFIFASSSSVYGVKSEPDVNEGLPLEPMTDYALYKALGEEILNEERDLGFETVVVRPATVCGIAPAMRLDLCVHILAMAALRTGIINVFGGNQFRPNIHIDDICVAYLMFLQADKSLVDGQTFNVGATNLTIMETALMVRDELGQHIKINVTSTNDNRSYHVSSKKVEKVLGFKPRHTVRDAIHEIAYAYEHGYIADPDDPRYYAIRKLKMLGLAA